MLTGRSLIALVLTGGKAFLGKVGVHTSRLSRTAEGAAEKFAGWFARRATQVTASAAKIRSDQVRNRMTAAGSFAAIALFAALSLDALLGGGLEFGSSAVAAQPAQRFVVLDALPEIPYQAPAATIAAPLDNARVVTVAYSPATEQLLGGPIADEEDEITVYGDSALGLTTDTADAPVKIEAPLPAEATKTVPF